MIVLMNELTGDLALFYLQGGQHGPLSIHRQIREERLSKGWTVLNVVQNNKGWIKLGKL